MKRVEPIWGSLRGGYCIAADRDGFYIIDSDAYYEILPTTRFTSFVSALREAEKMEQADIEARKEGR